MSIFFSLFGPDTFYKVLTAVMLERSIIFVHENAMVVSNVIFALKTLLRPFMWCYTIIPVLPRPMFDYLLLPIPELVGISLSDYELALTTTSECERKEKTWIFLDAAVSLALEDNPMCLPFQGDDSHDIDSRSGIRIVWGNMDGEFKEEYRTNMLCGWLDQMKSQADKLFTKFYKEARMEETGTAVLSSFEHFKDETGADDQVMATEAVTRPSLGEIAMSNRKKIS